MRVSRSGDLRSAADGWARGWTRGRDSQNLESNNPGVVAQVPAHATSHREPWSSGYWGRGCPAAVHPMSSTEVARRSVRTVSVTGWAAPYVGVNDSSPTTEWSVA